MNHPSPPARSSGARASYAFPTPRWPGGGRGFHFFGDKVNTAACISYIASDVEAGRHRNRPAMPMCGVSPTEALVRNLSDKLRKAHGAGANKAYIPSIRRRAWRAVRPEPAFQP